MIKKIIALGLALIGAFIILPSGFGLWNENLSVRGQISVAVSSPETSEQAQAGEEASPADSVAGDSCNETDNGQEAITEEPSNSAPAQSEPVTEDNSTITSPDNGFDNSPDNSSDEEPDSPQPVTPVDAAENTESSKSIFVPSDEANVG